MWLSTDIVRVAELVLPDMEHTDASNEDVEFECVDKLKVAVQEWTRTEAGGRSYWQ